MLEPGFEIVHTMTDFYDGSRRGIANFKGQPHLYVSEWNEKEQDFSAYRISPVSNDVFLTAMEDWSIWRRWETAFHQGKTTRETHPALPVDRERHQELEQILRQSLVLDEKEMTIVRGEFRCDLSWDGFGDSPLEVRWTIVESQ